MIGVMVGYLLCFTMPFPLTPQSNNSMHPTASQPASHRELVRSGVVCAAGDAGRGGVSWEPVIATFY